MNGAALLRVVPPRRCLSWLGAVVLLVLIATAGLPAGDGAVGTGPRIEVVEGCPVPALAVGEAPRPAHGQVLPVPAWPRALPRTRSVLTRGLPPPRAPTA